MSWRLFPFGSKARIQNEEGQTLNDPKTQKPLELDLPEITAPNAGNGKGEAGAREGKPKKRDTPPTLDATALEAAIKESPYVKSLQQELEQRKTAEMEAAKKARVQARAQLKRDAETFADSLIGDESRRLPFERKALIGGYLLAASDDARRPVKEGMMSRLDIFKQLAAGPEPHKLTKPLTAHADAEEADPIESEDGIPIGVRLPQRTAAAKDKPMSAERRAELLALTETGQAVIDAERRRDRA